MTIKRAGLVLHKLAMESTAVEKAATPVSTGKISLKISKEAEY
jgi:hypothetical protein